MSRRAKLEQILTNEPDDVFANYALAMELAKEGQVADALFRFDRVLALDSNYCAAYYHKGNTLLAHGRAPEAKVVLEAGIVAARKSGDHHSADEMTTLLSSALD